MCEWWRVKKICQQVRKHRFTNPLISSMLQGTPWLASQKPWSGRRLNNSWVIESWAHVQKIKCNKGPIRPMQLGKKMLKYRSNLNVVELCSKLQRAMGVGGQLTSGVLKGGQSQLRLLLPSAMSHNLFEQRARSSMERKVIAWWTSPHFQSHFFGCSGDLLWAPIKGKVYDPILTYQPLSGSLGCGRPPPLAINIVAFNSISSSSIFPWKFM